MQSVYIRSYTIQYDTCIYTVQLPKLYEGVQNTCLYLSCLTFNYYGFMFDSLKLRAKASELAPWHVTCFRIYTVQLQLMYRYNCIYTVQHRSDTVFYHPLPRLCSQVALRFVILSSSSIRVAVDPLT